MPVPFEPSPPVCQVYAYKLYFNMYLSIKCIIRFSVTFKLNFHIFLSPIFSINPFYYIYSFWPHLENYILNHFLFFQNFLISLIIIYASFCPKLQNSLKFKIMSTNHEFWTVTCLHPNLLPLKILSHSLQKKVIFFLRESFIGNSAKNMKVGNKSVENYVRNNLLKNKKYIFCSLFSLGCQTNSCPTISNTNK